MSDWRIFTNNKTPHNGIDRLPPAPPWRRFVGDDRATVNFRVDDKTIDLVNAALYLRRPLLVKGKPGIGKSSLAYAVAYQLGLGPVLVWPITSRSTVQDALYRYDAIGRLQDFNIRKAQFELEKFKDKQEQLSDKNSLSILDEQIGQFIQLGPLGTALLPSNRPRVLLIDEIDKSDFDLPNDLLYIFENGRYEIRELTRIKNTTPVVQVFIHDSAETQPIKHGEVICQEFPFVVITSNDERDLPPAFKRRCLILEMEAPNREKLEEIVNAHFEKLPISINLDEKITYFLKESSKGHIATDQLLNAIYLLTRNVDLDQEYDESGSDDQISKKRRLIEYILHHLITQDNK